MKKLAFTGFIISALIFSSVTAGSGDNYYSNSNRAVFTSPKSAALAGADQTFNQDAAPEGNPANLGLYPINEVSFAFADFYSDVFNTFFLSYTGRLNDHSGFGVSLNYLYVPGIPIYDNLELNSFDDPIYDPDKIDYSSSSEIMFRAGYGHSFQVKKNMLLGVGATLNALRRNLLGYTGYGIGVDAAATFELTSVGLRAALVAHNISTNYIYWNEDYYDLALPQVRVGIGWEKEIPYIYGRLQVNYYTPDFLGNEGVNSLARDDSVKVPDKIRLSNPDEIPSFIFHGNLGVEYLIRNRVAIRFGSEAINILETSRFTFGGGVYIIEERLALDFAYLFHELAGTYQVGGRFRW
ncbi:MAG: hypothetical protein GF401_04030 [Chitinivibrionales bacterium]|nr:hypothetical protein [Chitinivibrionales bacterium]